MILLFKKGDSKIVRGISCDILRCKPKEMDYYLSQGYVKDPGDLEKKPESVMEDVLPVEVEAEKEVENVE